MQLVIDISEDSYKATCNGCMLPPDVENVVNAIKNGTPLPKGHGRLIDADALEKKMCEAIQESSAVSVTLDMFAPTIIEAESEE